MRLKWAPSRLGAAPLLKRAGELVDERDKTNRKLLQRAVQDGENVTFAMVIWVLNFIAFGATPSSL